ncbi:MAG: glycosyl hydrolase [Planctomycetota bacterium]
MDRVCRLVAFGLVFTGSGFSGACAAFVQDGGEAEASEAEDADRIIKGSAFGALKARSIGPALASGRIGDFAVNPDRPAEYYVAVCSGNVWKTVNDGITYEPIFDGEAVYSIGCVTADPKNFNVVWVGTGENNSQRSVAWGNGVYKSLDGGKNWDHVGLEESEHIGMIAIHPDDSDVVFVAAMGPLWNAGGDRGLYRTTDGGDSWDKVLDISEHTGVNEVYFCPEDPSIMYATAYQRRRHVHTLINGGPESGFYKSSDGGETWREVTRGLPGGDRGRHGMAISADPNRLYMIVEATGDKGGVFRSEDKGETWTRSSTYMSSSPQYYNELVADPNDPDVVWSLDTFLRRSVDAGESFPRVPIVNKHVDDHALWINPDDSSHVLVGSDGGIYDTYDGGENWRFRENLPLTQYYKLALDNAEPFYNVYGGTQDNNTHGGPSRTTSRAGIANEDWFVTVGGDGFEPAIDPTDPNIVYSQWQYGNLVRHDRRSGEITDIKPQHNPGEDPVVYNWDAPLLISPHSHTRLYYGGRVLYRSDNRGDSWTRVSGDLTRGIDRDTIEVMGEIQKPDAVSKHRSTSIYGNTVALDESPLVEGLIYVGTDDGLVHVTEDGGGNWREIGEFPGVPSLSYVSMLHASPVDEDVVFATFSNHKEGDFTPYILKSEDRGRTWASIASDLPEDNVVWAVRQDHVDGDILFVGTEFGAYFTLDGGAEWHKVNGLPTIAVRDVEIQRRENDVAFATFGRSFYILDNYAPLREVDEEVLTAEAHLFAVKDAPLYVERSRLGGRNGRGHQGATFWTAENPHYGAVFTYNIGEKFTTAREDRLEAEKEDGWEYPSLDQLSAEDRERAPKVYLTVRDDAGNVVRRVDGSRNKGMHRVAWDLRYPSLRPARLRPEGAPDWGFTPRGFLVAPGTYSVTLDMEDEGQVRRLAGPESFEVYALNLATFATQNYAEVEDFQREVGELDRAMRGGSEILDDAQQRVRLLRVAVMSTRASEAALLGRIEATENALETLQLELGGDPVAGRRSYPQPLSISNRVSIAMNNTMFTTSPPTGTAREQLQHASAAFGPWLGRLRTIVEQDIPAIEQAAEELGAPFTPGRFPEWSDN